MSWSWSDHKINNRYHEVLRICLPLVLGMSATTIMEFTDRIFLSNYSLEAISAAVPAGITSYLFLSFFGGIGSYAGVFIAQYFGAGSMDRIGKVLWQGIYFTLFSGLILFFIAQFGTKPIFQLAGHDQAVRELEEIYFSILTKGAVLHVAMTTLATFFTGRGITRPVMIITVIGVAVNIPLDYALIFGRWGLPEMGITGAAIATVAAWAINTFLLLLLIFQKKYEKEFKIFSGAAFRPDLLVRFLKYGVPGSLQFTLDILAFTLFILLVGRIGTVELAATNIVLSISAVAFMPSMGVSQGVSVMVGQCLGKRKPHEARKLVWSSTHLLMVYILLLDLALIFFPELILSPFIQTATENSLGREVTVVAATLLKIVSAYLFFDSLYMIFSGALKGAGDTYFLMWSIGISSLLCLILPVYCGITYFNMTVTGAWLCVLLFIVALFCIAAGRYSRGKWASMLVIE